MPKDDREKPQLDKFKELAKELGCDDDEEAFRAKLRRVAKAPPQHRDKPKAE
jgi:hypothetical protein